MFQFEPIPHRRVRITDQFWSERQRVNARTAIPREYDHSKETGRLDALLLKWKPGEKNAPHHFWDSDTAKWLEAACYAWKAGGNPALREKIDEVAALFIGAQQRDGYINSYFTTVCPEKRWKNLRDMHELYCAGHIFEAAVAHYEATGTRSLLEAACRFADYIGSVFGLEPGKMPGYCGHEEIELALVRLYKATGEKRYLDLAAYFLNQRGQQPYYFVTEHGGLEDRAPWMYLQCEVPVREQKEATGHAVRAMYLFTAMADVARETGDETLYDAAQRLWRNVVDCKMYITGAVGSQWHGETFTGNYDLPNERAYCETCASVGLVFWAHRMLQHDGEGEYGDVLERALHNGALCGMSLDGERFFYQNPLASFGGHHRSEWFGCSCCPSNISRLIASLGDYIYSRGPEILLVNQLLGGDVGFELANGVSGKLKQEGGYPWHGVVKIRLEVDAEKKWELRVRIPAWAEGFELRVSGNAQEAILKNGYASIARTWKSGDTVEIDLPMPVRRMVSDPRVVGNAGQVALQRGPFVYCIEDADLEASALEVNLPREEKLEARVDESLFPIPVTVIEGECEVQPAAGAVQALYREADGAGKRMRFRGVPFFSWDNRNPGDAGLDSGDGGLTTKGRKECQKEAGLPGCFAASLFAAAVALGAEAEEGHFMVLDDEAAGDDGATGEMERADAEVEDVLALAALEVVVVAKVGGFVAGLAAGQDDALDVIGLKEKVDGTIDGGDAQRDLLLRQGEDLRHGERAVRFGEDFQDRFALAGLPLAEGSGLHWLNIYPWKVGRVNRALWDYGLQRRSGNVMVATMKGSSRWWMVGAGTALFLLMVPCVVTAQNLPTLKPRLGPPVLQELMGGCSLRCAFPWEVTVLSPGKGERPVYSTNDDDASTAWIDDSPTSVGTKLIFRFPKKLPKELEETPFYGFDMANGYIKSEALWKSYARVKRAKLYYNNKPMYFVEFADTRHWQYIVFDDILTHQGDSVTLEILEVYPGTKSQDAAITELVLQGAH